MNETLPRLALVTLGLRRDVLAPLRYITRLEPIHFYRDLAYGDLEAADLDATLHAFQSPTELYRQVVAAKPALLQSVEPFSYYTQPYLWAIYFAARRTGAKLIVPAFENRPLHMKFGKLRGAFLAALLRVNLKHAARMIVLNTGAEENARACGATARQLRRALWGVWGVDTEEFVPRAGVPPKPDVILFAGRLHVEKGVFVLLDAFEHVVAQFPETQLWFAGDGPARAELLAEINARKLETRVSLLGMLKHRRMPLLLQQAAILCAPSLTTRKWAEQVGSTALQAMSCGIPIVSTQSGAIPEFVPHGQAGLLVQEGDAHELADAMTFLLANPDQARAMGAFGRALAVEKYDARANILCAENLLFETLADNSK